MRKVGKQAGPRAVSQFIGKSTRASLVRRGFAQADILSKWESIVGPTLARASSPERMSFNRHNNREATLKVRVAPGFAPEFMQFEPLIVERINSFFGYKAVGRLNLVQAPVKLPKKPEKRALPELSKSEIDAYEIQLSDVRDDDLRTRLARLGLRIKNKSGNDE
ncbi:MAG: DUF721 domain-containing protein [Sneathiella sp.]|nr:DUF721 domain-containing protein [Sneathiella sp.]